MSRGKLLKAFKEGDTSILRDLLPEIEKIVMSNVFAFDPAIEADDIIQDVAEKMIKVLTDQKYGKYFHLITEKNIDRFCRGIIQNLTKQCVPCAARNAYGRYFDIFVPMNFSMLYRLNCIFDGVDIDLLFEELCEECKGIDYIDEVLEFLTEDGEKAPYAGLPEHTYYKVYNQIKDKIRELYGKEED